MASLPTAALNSVVAVGTKDRDDPNAETTPIGTGFMYGAPADEPGKVRPFLVTNSHVLNATEGHIVIKIKGRNNQPAPEFGLDIRNTPEIVTTRQDGLDIAVTPIPTVVWEYLPAENAFVLEDDLLSIAKANEVGIGEGDSILAVGFPMGIVGYQNYISPIVRQGCIASIQDWLSGRTRNIMIDANVFPGNSGGPVFLRPPHATAGETKDKPKAYLIGMVRAYLPYQEIATDPRGTARILFQEHSGLAEIVPSDVIAETVRMAAAHPHYRLAPNAIATTPTIPANTTDQ